ncbi:MAG: hypothetical protein IPK19_05065 [Chloroflexi bacterium]|nr:hypothetical protein [Chloroflexota bacterium]
MGRPVQIALLALLLLALPAQAQFDSGYNDRDSPADLLASYYDALNRQDYARAYAYWETPPNDYNRFVAGYAETLSTQVIIQPPTRIEGAAGSLYVAVPTVLLVQTRTGTEQMFAGCFTVRKSNLPPETSPDLAWSLYDANLVRVAVNYAAIPSLLTAACPI